MIQKSNKSRNNMRRLMLCAAFLTPVIATLISVPVFADCDTGILPKKWCGDDGLMIMVKDIIWILSCLIWVLGGIFIVICGVIWMTAADDPGKVATAKRRILEITIGIILFIAINVVINFLGIGS